MESQAESHRKAVIGNPSGSFWLYDSRDGFDLTHPKSPSDQLASNTIKIQTTNESIIIDPTKSALVIIDMQNTFLSTYLGRQSESNGLKAQERLLQDAIPAARKAGIRIIWLNWGLTEEDILNMPPSVIRTFGFDTVDAKAWKQYTKRVDGASDDQLPPEDISTQLESSGKSIRIYRGLGESLGQVKLEDGTSVDAGPLLMRDSWNARLTPELEKQYLLGLKSSPADKWLHKNRMSGFWEATSEATRFCTDQGTQTLFFAGVNTDQCVNGSLQDAYSRGFDCILLTDACGTGNPEPAKTFVEMNTERIGFCTDCKSFRKGVEEVNGEQR